MGYNMNGFLEFARTRRSIRKYEDRDIPLSDIEDLVKAAVTAPSGCNSQCWKFVAVRDRDVINKIKEAVENKIFELFDDKNKLSEEYITSKKKMVGFFSKAPVTIAVFMTKLEFYDPTLISALKSKGYSDSGIMDLFANPDLLSIGAAVQNLLLAAHEKGFGACWINEPAIAGKEISKILNIPEEYKFISLIPVGYPAYSPRNKRMKDFGDIFTSI